MLLADSNHGYVENPTPVPVPTETVISVEATPTPVAPLVKKEETNSSWMLVWVFILVIGIVAFLSFKNKK